MGVALYVAAVILAAVAAPAAMWPLVGAGVIIALVLVYEGHRFGQNRAA